MRWRSVLEGIVVAGVAACDVFPTAPGPFAASRIERSWVVGAAAAALRDGQLPLPAPPYLKMAPARADSMALAMAEFLRRAWGDVVTSGFMAEEHGGPVQFFGLRLCGRDYWEQSPLDVSAVPDTNAMQFYGPRYAIPLCSRDARTQLVVDVGDAPDRSIIRDGTFAPPWSNGNEIAGWAASPAADHGLPVSPEQAIEYVYRTTRARVDELPTALANHPQVSECMRWHLHLEREVTLMGSSGARYTTRDVYVRRLPACARGDLVMEVPLASQPASVFLFYPHFLPGAPPGAPPALDSVRVPVVAPLHFERVTVAQ